MTTLEAAEAGIKAMERFFASIGMPTDIHTLIGKEVTDAQIEEMAQKCTGDTIKWEIAQRSAEQRRRFPRQAQFKFRRCEQKQRGQKAIPRSDFCVKRHYIAN